MLFLKVKLIFKTSKAMLHSAHKFIFFMECAIVQAPSTNSVKLQTILIKRECSSFQPKCNQQQEQQKVSQNIFLFDRLNTINSKLYWLYQWMSALFVLVLQECSYARTFQYDSVCFCICVCAVVSSKKSQKYLR